MLNPASAGGWLVFLPSIWIIQFYYVYALIHMRHVLRTIDIIIGGLVVRYLCDCVITYPIVIHYIIRGYVFNYSDCKAVIWFNQCGYWFSLGLVTALVIDVTIQMQRLTGNNLASKISKVPNKYKFICLGVWWLLSAIIAGAFPAKQWTFATYRNEIRAACTYLPFMQNSDYAIFLVVITTLCLFFCLFMGIECLIRLNQVHLFTVMKQTQATSGGLQYQRRRTKRLIQSLRVTALVTFVVCIGSHFTAIVLNLHGLVQPNWDWKPLVLAHFWMYLVELLLLPILLIAFTSRYRHPLYVLFHWAIGNDRPDKVCALEESDRRLKSTGEPLADETIVNRGYSNMTSVPTITVYEEVDFNDKQNLQSTIKDVRQQNSQQALSVDLHPAYQSEPHTSTLPRRSSSGVNEELFVEEKLPNKRMPPRPWIDSPEVQPKPSNLLLRNQARNSSRGAHGEEDERPPVIEEVLVQEKAVKRQSAPVNFQAHSNPAFLEEDNLKVDEELKEASIMFEDDVSLSRGNSDLADWEKDYSNQYRNTNDNGYNSFRNLEMLSEAQRGGKNRVALNDSFWLSQNEVE